jgi:hypothetical protein
MRENDERLAPPQAPAVPQSNVGGLNYVIPTEIVDLPSKGRFYPQGHPLYGQETIEIKQMTAKEEDILTSLSLIEKGVVLDYLIQSLLLNKSINAKTLLPGDRSAILLNARIHGYGPEYKIGSICSSCDVTNELMIDLLKIKNKELDIGGDTIRLELPKTGFPVTIRFLNAHEEDLLEKEVEKKVKLGYNNSTFMEFMKFIVVSVNGITASDAVISQFLENMPAADARFIKESYAKSKPDIDFTAEIECSSCSHVERREVPLTAQFFWPQS